LALHSFPTRRSSDLPALGRSAARAGGRDRPGRGGPGGGSAGGAHGLFSRGGAGHGGGGGGAPLPAHPRAAGDRRPPRVLLRGGTRSGPQHDRRTGARSAPGGTRRAQARALDSPPPGPAEGPGRHGSRRGAGRVRREGAASPPAVAEVGPGVGVPLGSAAAAVPANAGVASFRVGGSPSQALSFDSR